MKQKRFTFLLLFVANLFCASAQKWYTPEIDQKVEDLLKQMTVEEKLGYIGGVNWMYTKSIDRLGIHRMKMSDGPQGLGTNGKSTAYPSTVTLAATWNENLAYQYGKALGRDCRARNVNVILGPAVNIYRAPMCGRNFEYFSEDPLLTGKFAAAITKGVQKNRGCYVTLKHYCCNNQEDNRNKTNANVNERALREIYLKGFEIAVKESHPGAVMSSYNKVNGKYVNNSYRLLTQVLRNEWGFDGFVMTDWFATGRKYGDPAHAIASGNDLIMPGSSGTVDDIVKAVSKGIILEEDVKRSAANVLKGIISSRIYQGYLRKQRESGV